MQSGQDASAPGERPGVNLGLTAAADRARPGSSTATPGTARGHPADIADRGLHGRNTGGPRRGTGPAGRGPRLAVLRPTPYLLPIRPVPGAWWLYRIQNRSRAECRCRRGATVPVRCPTHPLQHSRSDVRDASPGSGARPGAARGAVLARGRVGSRGTHRRPTRGTRGALYTDRSLTMSNVRPGPARQQRPGQRAPPGTARTARGRSPHARARTQHASSQMRCPSAARA